MKLDILKFDPARGNSNGHADNDDEELHAVLSNVQYEIFTSNEKRAIDASTPSLKAIQSNWSWRCQGSTVSYTG